MIGEGAARIGLGCMRLSTEPERVETRAIATIHAALDGGCVVFDTARAYGLDDGDRGHNERLLARALASHARGGEARVVTKGGMTRPDGAWRPDGRARAIAADCEESLRALDGRSIDLYLLHAPDPRVEWAVSVRALASLVERGLVKRIGVSNVNRAQLREALELAPLSAIEVALGAGEDEALRGGVVQLALERGLWVLAHGPLGGPKRAPKLARDRVLAPIAERAHATAAQVVLRWIVGLHARVIALPGARNPETARASLDAGKILLSDSDRAILDEKFGTIAPPARAAAASDREVVLIAGISGSGKTTAVARFVAEGYERLNRDERGGTLAKLAAALDARLAAGARRVALDNTYVTRASRAEILRVAARHGAAVRCAWLDTPVAEAQRNAIERMLEAHGALVPPEELARGADDPTRLPPRAINSQAQKIEAPELDEGFASVEVVPFVRRARPGHDRAARAVALESLVAHGPAALDGDEPGPRLIFAWLPDGDAPLVEAAKNLASTLNAENPANPKFTVETAACTHPGGPPICWCRPPLPGLLLAFAWRHRVDPARLTVVGASAAHRRLAAAAGARFVELR